MGNGVEQGNGQGNWVRRSFERSVVEPAELVRGIVGDLIHGAKIKLGMEQPADVTGLGETYSDAPWDELDDERQ